jgi:hypothetical protein
MTWHSFFSMSTLESRHLVFAYATVLVIQGGYLAHVAWQWCQTKRPHR